MSDKHYKRYSKTPPADPKGFIFANGSGVQKAMVALLAPASPSFSKVVKQTMHGIFFENPYLKTIYDPLSIDTSQYEFPLDDAGFREVEEIMLESYFSFSIPIQYLKMCLDVESKRISALESIGDLAVNWEPIRQKKLAQSKLYFEKYQTRLDFVEKRYNSPFFKKSTSKTKENLDFVPINLHFQRLRVYKNVISSLSPKNSSPTSSSFPFSSSSAKSDCSNYDIISVGATANHFMGFKNGGLLQLLTVKDPYAKSCKNPFESPTHLSRNQANSSEEMLFEQIVTLHSRVKGRIEELKTLLLSNASNPVNAELEKNLKVSLSNIKAGVNSFLDCCDSSLVTSSMTALNDARPAYRPLSGCLDETNLFPEVARRNPKLELKNYFEEVKRGLEEVSNSMKTSQESSLENFLKGQLLDIPTSMIEDCVASLLSALDDLFSGCVSALSFRVMTQKKTTINPEISFRRNSVFSQALALCACAVATLLTSSLHNQELLEQFSSVGILLQAESLLSTYGSEKGMIQDYVVGISDLRSVTFRCVLSVCEAMGSQNDNFLPIIQGTTNAPIIELPFDEPSFRLLPNDLQQGKLIKICPTIFNVGINEEQTIANTIGDTSLQDHINDDSFKKMADYCSMAKKCCSYLNHETTEVSPIRQTPSKSAKKISAKKRDTYEDRSLDGLLKRLHISIKSKKNGKNVEILELAADICRRVNGVRVISCKSAKDRTAMGVTLEQARILRDHHSVAPIAFSDVLNCMRSEGTRLKNTWKNTGYRQYAFSSIQLKTFPKLYKPPDGTYGKGET